MIFSAGVLEINDSLEIEPSISETVPSLMSHTCHKKILYQVNE